MPSFLRRRVLGCCALCALALALQGSPAPAGEPPLTPEQTLEILRKYRANPWDPSIAQYVPHPGRHYPASKAPAGLPEWLRVVMFPASDKSRVRTLSLLRQSDTYSVYTYLTPELPLPVTLVWEHHDPPERSRNPEQGIWNVLIGYGDQAWIDRALLDDAGRPYSEVVHMVDAEEAWLRVLRRARMFETR